MLHLIINRGVNVLFGYIVKLSAVDVEQENKRTRTVEAVTVLPVRLGVCDHSILPTTLRTTTIQL